MNVKSLELQAFRNIGLLRIEPCEGVNVIFGDNAQGKTNLLEALWLFTGCKSFRTVRDRELISFDAKSAFLDLDYFAGGRDQTMSLQIEKTRVFTHNGILKGAGSKVIGEIQAVIFAPTHLNLVKGGPGERRRFLDIAISQLKPKYASVLMKYNKALAQRNALLKDLALHPELADTLDAWEDRLAHYATEIIRQRVGYVNLISDSSCEIYSGISSHKEEFAVSYKQAIEISGAAKEEMTENGRRLLKQHRSNDIAAGFTTVGPHRDDLSIKIDGSSARLFGSQGQQRSASLALKLGEAAVIKNFSGQQPIALLDDVMSELDPERQNYIFNHIKDWQVFITCCDPKSVGILKGGKKFHVRGGNIV